MPWPRAAAALRRPRPAQSGDIRAWHGAFGNTNSYSDNTQYHENEATQAEFASALAAVTSGTNGGRHSRAFCDKLRINDNLEEGLKREQARNQPTLTIIAAVTPSGRAAIKRLLVDGTAVYESRGSRAFGANARIFERSFLAHLQ